MVCGESLFAGCAQEREDAVCVTMNYIRPMEVGIIDYTDEKHNHHSDSLWQDLPIKIPLSGPGGLIYRHAHTHEVWSSTDEEIASLQTDLAKNPLGNDCFVNVTSLQHDGNVFAQTSL